MSAQELIKIAKAEVGYHEGRSNGHWNNHQKYSPAVPTLEWSQNQAWCCTFVCWCAKQAGVANLFPVTASCNTAGAWFKAQGRWSEYPAIGSQFFLGKDGDLYHTGIVYDYNADQIFTIEGNTNDSGSAEGDGVYLKVRNRRDPQVVGYGLPRYAEGIKSADPAYAAKPAAPKPIPKPKAPTHVQQARTQLDQALITLSKASPQRARVHQIRKEIEGLAKQLPLK